MLELVFGSDDFVVVELISRNQPREDDVTLVPQVCNSNE